MKSKEHIVSLFSSNFRLLFSFLPAATASRRSSNGSSCCCCCSCCSCCCFRDISQYLKVAAAKEARVLERQFGEEGVCTEGSNPEESFIRELSTYVRHVLARCQDFLRGWIPESQGIQPRRKFYTRSQYLCLTGLGDVSRLSSGLDP